MKEITLNPRGSEKYPPTPAKYSISVIFSPLLNSEILSFKRKKAKVNEGQESWFECQRYQYFLSCLGFAERFQVLVVSVSSSSKDVSYHTKKNVSFPHGETKLR